MIVNYVIIGNSAAAIGAVEAIRKTDSENPITIISSEAYHTYSRPLISYYLFGKVKEDKMYYRPLDFYEKNGVTLLGGKAATAIDTEGKTVILEDGTKVAFDKLLVATGGKPFVPKMEGLDKKEIYTFQKWDDVKAIEKALSKKPQVVIIGAGLIGMKAAEALNHLGLNVTIVELADRVLSSILDNQAAAYVQAVMESQGIKFCFGNTVSQVLGEEAVSGVRLSDGQELDCDMLIVAIGVVPNTDVVKNTAIQVNRGILIDEHAETSVPGIYAAGDVAEGYDMLLNNRRVIPILPGAYKQGEIAGFNMAGEKKEYQGGFPMNSIGFFGYPMITAGLYEGKEAGCEVLVKENPAEKSYKRIVLKDGKLIGFIAIKDIDRAGMLTGMIRDKIELTNFDKKMLNAQFGYIDWPKELRKERMLVGGGVL